MGSSIEKSWGRHGVVTGPKRADDPDDPKKKNTAVKVPVTDRVPVRFLLWVLFWFGVVWFDQTNCVRKTLKLTTKLHEVFFAVTGTRSGLYKG